jgi:thioesterase domain-containing protein
VRWQARLAITRFRSLRVLQPPAVRQAEEVRDRHREAFRVYAGGRIQHDLLLVRSEEWLALHDPAWYDEWLNLTTGEVRIVSVPGTHATMLNPPHVRELAAQLRRALAAAASPS